MKMSMVKHIVLAILVTVSFLNAAVVTYTVQPGGEADHWVYEYSIYNDSTEPLQGFTIWFDANLASQFVDESIASIKSHWDPGFQHGVVNKGDGFDALTYDAGILPRETLSGFSVSFKWNGVDAPAQQNFEIYNPNTFEMIYEGVTVPEPASVLLLAGGTLALWRKRK